MRTLNTKKLIHLFKRFGNGKTTTDSIKSTQCLSRSTRHQCNDGNRLASNSGLIAVEAEPFLFGKVEIFHDGCCDDDDVCMVMTQCSKDTAPSFAG